MLNSLKGKIVIPIIVILVLIVAVIIWYSARTTRLIIEDFAQERMDSATQAVQAYLAAYEKRTAAVASAMGTSGELARLIREGNREVTWQYVFGRKVHFEVDEIIVAGIDGVTIARSHMQDSYGDDVSGVPSVAAGLNREFLTLYTRTPTAYMVMTSAAPVMDGDTHVGSVVVNFVIGSNEFLDQIARTFDIDATVFIVDGTSVASTLIHPDTGNRAVGTVARADIVEQVIGRGENMAVELSVFGFLPFYAYYFPLIGADDRPSGMFFVGISQQHARDITIGSRVNLILFGLVGVIIAGAVMFFWIMKLLNPLSGITKNAKEVAGGNINVSIDYSNISAKDEIGQLAQSFGDMQHEISSLIDEVEKRNKEIIKGNLSPSNSGFSSKGAFQRILDNVDSVAASMFKYLNDLPCTLLIVDRDYRINFMNTATVEQGYDIDSMMGNSILDAISAEEAKELKERFDRVNSTGQLLRTKVEMQTSDGIITDDQVIVPIKDSNGKISVYVVFGYDITEIANSQRRSEKVSTYQDYEASEMTAKLQDGLEKGILKFGFAPKPHDEDTADAAAAYTRIGSTLEEAVAFIKGYIDELSQTLQEFSNKNFDVTMKQNYIGDFSTIKSSVEGLVGSIGSLVSEIQTSTAQVTTGAEQIAQSTQELMASFEEQATSVSLVREAIINLSEKTQQNAQQVTTVNGLSEAVNKVANEGVEQMQVMFTAMDEIKQSSEEIAKVVSAIEGIAFQTNLLALNASVEAARAGEHGKGFSVVAEEVRNLAMRSAEAAKSTSDLIAESENRIQVGVKRSMETTEAFRNIAKNIDDITKAVADIAEVSSEQAEEINRIQHSMEAVYAGMSDNAEAVQSSASVSEGLSAQVQMLMALVDTFRVRK